MRICVYGAGGVGAYVGGRLLAGGHDVRFVARGKNLEALRTQGLRIKSAQGDLVLPTVSATDDPGSIGPVDAVLFGVKLYDLESAAAALQPLLGTNTMVVPVQNGVDAAQRLAAVLQSAHVVKGAVYVVSFLSGPGQVEHRSPFCKLVLAEFDNQASGRTAAFASALNASGVEATVSPDIELDLWRKFAMLAPFAAVACLARSNVGEVLSNPPTRSLLSDAITEVVAVARARGMAMPDETAAATLQAMGNFPPLSRPSMLLDLEAGRPLELESLSGAVARFGQQAGVPTPVHDVAYRALSRYIPGTRVR